jgi:hypothetical protein
MCLSGAIAFLLYPLRLFFRANPLAEECTLTYYLAATCGAVGIAWGMGLYRLAGTVTGRKMLATPTAMGFLLLAASRLLTVPYGSQVFHVFPYDTLNTVVPWIEVVIFGALGLAFWRVASTQ